MNADPETVEPVLLLLMALLLGLVLYFWLR